MILVRHDGRVMTHDVEEACKELLDDLGEEPGFDLIGFVIRNMGWVWFKESDHEVELWFNPSTVTLAAIVAVVSMLIRSPARIFTLRYLGSTGWEVERSSDRDLIVSALDRVCATSFVGSGRRFHIETMSVTSVTDPTMRRLLDLWTTSNATFGVRTIDTLIRHGLITRMVIVQGDRHVLRFVGDGLAVLGGVTGVPIRDLPDREYGEWLESQYREVSTTQIPRYDKITTTIDAPTLSRVVTYDRLMLPWRCSDAAGTIITTLSTHMAPPVDFARVKERGECVETLACSLYRSIKAILGMKVRT